jgi:hypothetical protein
VAAMGASIASRFDRPLGWGLSQAGDYLVGSGATMATGEKEVAGGLLRQPGQASAHVHSAYWPGATCRGHRISRHALIPAGSDKRNPARKNDTLWVRKKPSLSSSRSTGF